MNRRTLAFALAVLVSSCSPPPESEPEVAVRVESVTLDPHSNSPVLVLGELDGPRRQEVPSLVEVSVQKSHLSC